MNCDKYDKYVKYKNKYINQIKTNKIKYGGNLDNNILFACTTLYKGSTFSLNYNEILTTIDRLITNENNENKPNIYFVLNTVTNINNNTIDDNALREVENKFIIKKNEKNEHYYNNSINDFLKNYQIKFKIVALMQCNDLVETFSNIISDNSVKVMDGYCILNKEIFFQNIELFYDSILPNGKLIIYYYDPLNNSFSLVSFEEYNTALLAFSSPLTYTLIVCILNRLFSYNRHEKYYTKNVVDNVKRVCEQEFYNLFIRNKYLQKLIDDGIRFNYVDVYKKLQPITQIYESKFNRSIINIKLGSLISSASKFTTDIDEIKTKINKII